MSHRFSASMAGPAVVIGVALAAPAPVAAQSASSTAKTADAATTWTTPRTADGQPDLQGVWDYRTITPMQRPLELGTKEFFASDEEAAAWERTENRRQDRDAEDLETGGETHQPGDAAFGPKGAVPPGWAGGGGGVAGRAAYNEFWWGRGNKIG